MAAKSPDRDHDQLTDELAEIQNDILQIQRKCNEIQTVNARLNTKSDKLPRQMQDSLKAGIKFNTNACDLMMKYSVQTQDVLYANWLTRDDDEVEAIERQFANMHTNPSPHTDTTRRRTFTHGDTTTRWIVRNRANGNCLFESLAFGIGERAGSIHDNWTQACALRTKMCDFIVDNRNTYIFGSDHDTLENVIQQVYNEEGWDFDQYIAKMRNPFEFGGDIEIRVIVYMTRNITVKSYGYDKESRIRQTMEYTSPTNNTLNTTVRILYTNRGHYEALTRTKGDARDQVTLE